MKLSNFYPELPSILKQQHELDFLINELQQINKSDSPTMGVSDDDVYRQPTLGLDLIYGSWLKSAVSVSRKFDNAGYLNLDVTLKKLEDQ